MILTSESTVVGLEDLHFFLAGMLRIAILALANGEPIPWYSASRTIYARIARLEVYPPKSKYILELNSILTAVSLGCCIPQQLMMA